MSRGKKQREKERLRNERREGKTMSTRLSSRQVGITKENTAEFG